MRNDNADDSTPQLQWLEDAINMWLAAAVEFVGAVFRIAFRVSRALWRLFLR